MDLIYIALILLAVFIAVWFFFVVPAERRHHQRKLDMIEKKLAERAAARDSSTNPGSD